MQKRVIFYPNCINGINFLFSPLKLQPFRFEADAVFDTRFFLLISHFKTKKFIVVYVRTGT
jgi:hypothetical protein